MNENSINIVFSYSHRDEVLRDDLEKHLEHLTYFDVVFWHDRKLEVGEWEKSITDQIKKADIILLLTSADFLASPYCAGETKLAMEQYDSRGVGVVPIILSDCNWKSQPFAKFQTFPTGGLAINDGKWKN